MERMFQCRSVSERSSLWSIKVQGFDPQEDHLRGRPFRVPGGAVSTFTRTVPTSG